MDVRINADGTRVSFLTAADGSTTPFLRVVDMEGRTVQEHDFRPRGRLPNSQFWDVKEPKLLACETRSIDPSSDKNSVAEVATFFATPFDGLKLQDRFPVRLENGALFGLHVPHLLFVKRPEHRSTSTVNHSTILQVF